MGPDSDDPRSISSLAVTAGDVVAALEARYQRDRAVVLRVTPPFSGRMRARLHVTDEDGRGEREESGDAATRSPSPLHVPPGAFVDADAPPYPRAAETEDRLRSAPDTDYTLDRHHERHRQRVASWRERVRDHFVSETRIETPDGDVRVDVTVLG